MPGGHGCCHWQCHSSYSNGEADAAVCCAKDAAKLQQQRQQSGTSGAGQKLKHVAQPLLHQPKGLHWLSPVCAAVCSTPRFLCGVQRMRLCCSTSCSSKAAQCAPRARACWAQASTSAQRFATAGPSMTTRWTCTAWGSLLLSCGTLLQLAWSGLLCCGSWWRRAAPLLAGKQCTPW